MNISDLDLSRDVSGNVDHRRAFPFSCPWRVERELPAEPDQRGISQRLVWHVPPSWAGKIHETGDDVPPAHLPTYRPAERSDDERYSALAEIVGDASTLAEIVGGLHEWRCSLESRPDELTDEESAALDYSLASTDALARIERVARRRYRYRVDDLDDAAGFALSETLDYVITSVVAGRRSIPHSIGQWLAALSVVAPRYYDSLKIVIDGTPAGLLGDDDTSLSTGVRAARLQLDDAAFSGELLRLWRAGSGRDAPEYVGETIAILAMLPDATYSECAELCGVKPRTWKYRLTEVRAGIRAGLVGELLA